MVENNEFLTMGHPAQPVATLHRKHHDEDRRNEESHNGNGIKGHGNSFLKCRAKIVFLSRFMLMTVYANAFRLIEALIEGDLRSQVHLYLAAQYRAKNSYEVQGCASLT